MVYKPTPKCLLASSSSYSPPIKKPKLEYVPKSKSNITSIATYIPSSSIRSNCDGECADVQKSGWDYLAEIIDTNTSNVDQTPTYVPTKINRSTSWESTKSIVEIEKGSDDIARPIEEAATSANDIIKSTDDETENQILADNGKERKRSTSKPEKSKSSHDRHKSSSKSTSRSHSHSSRSKHDNSSKSSSSERHKSSKSTHRSSHDKDRSRSKSSIDKHGNESSKRSDKVTKAKVDTNKDDENVSKKKSKSTRKPTASVEKDSLDSPSINVDHNISPSSVFDTDSDEDDVMAQCRMIFEEFKEVSNDVKSNELVVSNLKFQIFPMPESID